MDLRFDTALRNASKAWAQNRTTDTVTLQHLKRHAPGASTTEASAHTTPHSSIYDLPTEKLARFGNVGTKLSVYA